MRKYQQHEIPERFQGLLLPKVHGFQTTLAGAGANLYRVRDTFLKKKTKNKPPHNLKSVETQM